MARTNNIGPQDVESKRDRNAMRFVSTHPWMDGWMMHACRQSEWVSGGAEGDDMQAWRVKGFKQVGGCHGDISAAGRPKREGGFI